MLNTGVTLLRGNAARVGELRVLTVDQLEQKISSDSTHTPRVVVAREGSNVACARDLIASLGSSFSETARILDALTATEDGELKPFAARSPFDDEHTAVWLFGARADWFASKEDWQVVLEGTTKIMPTRRGPEGQAWGTELVIPWPSRARCACFQNLLAAISQMNESYEQGNQGGVEIEDQPTAQISQPLIVSIACTGPDKVRDLVGWVRRRTMASMSYTAVLNLSSAREKMAKHLWALRRTIKEALEKESGSGVEDVPLQAMMEDLANLIGEEGGSGSGSSKGSRDENAMVSEALNIVRYSIWKPRIPNPFSRQIA